jgi:preprotein translocase subunit SecG
MSIFPSGIISRMILNVFLSIAQIILAIALIATVLIQSKGEELGGVFGGAQSVYQTRRGVDKLLFTITVLLAIAFFALAIVNVIVSAPQ